MLLIAERQTGSSIMEVLQQDSFATTSHLSTFSWQSCSSPDFYWVAFTSLLLNLWNYRHQISRACMRDTSSSFDRPHRLAMLYRELSRGLCSKAEKSTITARSSKSIDAHARDKENTEPRIAKREVRLQGM